MQLETINQLYLELSQIATTMTSKEIGMEQEIIRLREGIRAARQLAMEIGCQIEMCGASEDLTRANAMALTMQDRLNDLLPEHSS